MATSVFCYARTMVDMLDAVSGFKVFSELMSLAADPKKFSCSITGPLNA